MTLDKQRMARQSPLDAHRKTGADFEWYNNIPMFRYNAYFGIHTVHYMDLVGPDRAASRCP